ncbi:MAG: trans-sulfuration enzyme family protein [Promethearchaeota archaeon]|jgi:methionine-gamma-lyase
MKKNGSNFEEKRDILTKLNKKNMEKWAKMGFSTQSIHAGEYPYPETSFSLRTPIYATKSFAYNSFSELLNNYYNYSRTENPTLQALDQKLATLHKGESAISVASGMGAVHLACQSILQERIERKKPDKLRTFLPQKHPEFVPKVIIHKNQYTGVYRLLTKIYPQTGVDFIMVDLNDLNQLRKEVNETTKLLLFETPTNPTIDVIDIKSCAEIIHEVGGKCIVDNTFASPALQQPIELGADLVVESLTKYINGHGDCLGGAIVGSKNDIQNIRYFWLETQGQVLSPFNAWLILRGIRTLSLRMARHSSNALKIAQYLEKHPKVSKVIYPGLVSHPGYDLAKSQMKNFSGMIGFELESVDASNEFVELLKLIKVGVSLGDTTSLIEYTSLMTGIDLASWERKSMDISDTHFRFSVGLEDPEDLIDDLRQAFNQI